MTTMLERAARSAFDSTYVGDHPEYWWENSREAYIKEARAILESLMDVSDGIIVNGELAAWDSPNSRPAIRAMQRGFTAMIDAILSEEG